MKKILYILTLALLMVGCKNETESAQQSGVAVAVKLNHAFNSDTKAPINDDFPMEIKHLAAKITQNGQTIQQWDDLTKMPSIIKLDPAANYVFEIYTGGERKPMNSVPMYRGAQPFEVKAFQLTSLIIEAKIDCMAASVTLQGDLANVTDYKLTYYALQAPTEALFIVTQDQNTPAAKKIYFDKPFGFGVRIEGRYGGGKWSKNIIQYDNIDYNVLHTLIVK